MVKNNYRLVETRPNTKSWLAMNIKTQRSTYSESERESKESEDIQLSRIDVGGGRRTG